MNSLQRFYEVFSRRARYFVTNKISSIQIIVSYYILMTIFSLILFHLAFFREADSYGQVTFIRLAFHGH